MLLLSIGNLSLAQGIEGVVDDIKGIKDAKPIQFGGGFSTNHVFYAADGISARRNNPYTYYLQGNMNVNFYGKVNLPFTFSYSNQRFNYTYPQNQQSFNQFGMSPTYKWVTGHFGYRNMSFSPYTLNGHLFLGGGFELTPGDKFSISGMYGRFQKAVEFDSTQESTVNLPAYKRMGFGMKTSYKDKGDELTLIVFRAADEINSLAISPDSMGIFPEENFVWSLKGEKKLGKNLKVNLEYASSAYTKDKRSPDFASDNLITSTGILQSTTSTVFYDAINAGINYNLGGSSIGMGYERIDPEYRTLGAYYFNNDLENITVNGATSLFKQKVNLTFDVGAQRDNLDKSKISTMNRAVGSLNVGWAVNDKLNISTGYSTFQTFTNIRSEFVTINQLTPYDNLDTLNYTQIAQTLNLTVAYNVTSNDKLRQAINFNGNYQKADDEQNGEATNAGSAFYNANMGYTINFVPSNTSVTLNVNANRNESFTSVNSIFGPTLALSKTFFDRKIRTSLSSSWNASYIDADLANRILNIRLTNSFTIKKKHSINMSAVYLNRLQTNNLNTAPEFNEFTGTVGYNYRF